MQKTNKVELFLRKRENPSKKEKKVRLVCSLILIDICVWTIVFTSLPTNVPFVVYNPSPLILEAKAAIVEEKSLSIEEKIKAVFHEAPEIALALAKSESGLNPSMHSTTDRMKDGRAFSVGLMQTNLTVHRIGGKECFKAFSGRNYKAKVVDESLYAECVKLAMNPDISLETARGIYERAGSFNPWGAFTNLSYLSKL